MNTLRKPRRPKKMALNALEIVSRRLWERYRASFDIQRKDFNFKIENGKAHISFSVNLKKTKNKSNDPRFLEKKLEKIKKMRMNI